MAAFVFFDALTLPSTKEELVGYCPCCQRDISTKYDSSTPYGLEDARAKLTEKHLRSRIKRNRHCKGILIFS